MKKFMFSVILLGSVFFINSSQAQFSAQRDAKYIATLKAVADVKINDEENLRDIQNLRQNQYFIRDLERMLAKLENTRSKNSENKRVYDILIRAGEDIYNVLN